MKKLKLALMALLAVVVTVGCSSEPKQEEVNDEGKLTAAHEAVKAAYGEFYIPNMPLEAQMLEDIYGVKAADVKEFIAETPMIMTHVDTFIGIEAAEGKVDDVEAALVAYREKLVNDTMQYPMNLPKIQASEVIKIRNHVFFVMLGEINDEMMDASEEDQLAYAKEENAKAIEAIKEVFNK